MNYFGIRSTRFGGLCAFPNPLHRCLFLRSVLLAILMAVIFCSSLEAAQVELAWDPNNPAPNGYRVYQRVDGEDYDYSSPVWPRNGDDPTLTTCNIENLADDTTYYFVVRAYVGSYESGNSNEEQYETGSPVVTNPPPIDTYSITTTTGANGTITPDSATVDAGDSQTFTIVPANDYQVADVLVNGQSVGARTSYTFNDVNRNQTISASFAPDVPPEPDKYTITAAAGANGTITPGTATVDAGAGQTFTIVPANDYQVADVLVNGQSVGARTSYTFSDVNRNQTISASFAPDVPPEPIKYTITGTAGANGTITPVTATVNAGDSQTFTIVPATHYHVVDVLVDGKSVGVRSTYTFKAVDRDHTISATIEPDPIAITATTGANGAISPSGTVTVEPGGSQTFTIEADDGYEIEQLVVDGVSRNIENSYTFNNVTASHTISVSFASVANEPPVADAGPDQRVDEAREVTLSGLNSHDNDDGIAECLWHQISGPSVELSATDEDVVTFIAPDVDTDGVALEFEFTVTDGIGATAKDRCLVNVTWVNEVPKANAGKDQTAQTGATVVLFGEASTDPDDGIASYEWVQMKGPAVVLDDSSSPSPSFTAPDGGAQGESLKFKLTVTDNGGLQDTDHCIINVASENQEPVADAGPDQQATPGDELALDGSGSMDPEGSTLTFQWRQTDGFPVALSDAQAVAPLFTVPENTDGIDSEPMDSTSGNVLIFELTVTDDGGLSSVDKCEIELALPSYNHTEDEEPPEVMVVSPSRSFIMTRRSNITISGTASDNHQVDRVVWDDGRGNGGEVEGTDQWRINVPLRPWKNSITITAYDGAGNEKSKTLTIYAIYRYYSYSRYR